MAIDESDVRGSAAPATVIYDEAVRLFRLGGRRGACHAI